MSECDRVPRSRQQLPCLSVFRIAALSGFRIAALLMPEVLHVFRASVNGVQSKVLAGAGHAGLQPRLSDASGSPAAQKCLPLLEPLSFMGSLLSDFLIGPGTSCPTPSSYLPPRTPRTSCLHPTHQVLLGWALCGAVVWPCPRSGRVPQSWCGVPWFFHYT